MEYTSLEKLCLDGNRPMEMRQIRAEIGVVGKADGSAIFEMGNTKVIAAVYGPREVQNRSQKINDKALVRYEYSMANFCTGDRMRKRKGDRRSTEISLVIRQTMKACKLTHLMPRSHIDIFVQERELFSGNVEMKSGFQHSAMDSSLKGYALYPSKCSKLTIEQKGELLYQISEWSNDAAEML
ncbi:hypothetical protein GIB67_028524 [Kingdonia uniflora]|uniref:Exoribonuclease phosphorolytic domain-containing protein n=1 Tax=Kingdonia uniflora TaxID=39325 RepID=A0A7J7KVV9_9MAGN|nr:hypothetical protein GIB67_028524 [Kingdonia uniflora]